MSLQCRICFEAITIQPHIAPCACRGTSQYVCLSCYKTVVCQSPKCQSCQEHYPNYSMTPMLESAFLAMGYSLDLIVFVLPPLLISLMAMCGVKFFYGIMFYGNNVVVAVGSITFFYVLQTMWRCFSYSFAYTVYKILSRPSSGGRLALYDLERLMTYFQPYIQFQVPPADDGDGRFH